MKNSCVHPLHDWREQCHTSTPAIKEGSPAPSVDIMARSADYLVSTGAGQVRAQVSAKSVITIAVACVTKLLLGSSG